MVGDKIGFERAVNDTIQTVQFDLDSRVQVFETTIRILGGLISAHLFASDAKFGFKLDWYTDELLVMAADVGDRLMPAFASDSGIPHPRVNLRYGLNNDAVFEQCIAGAGTLLLEFGMLSRLSGDPKYEQAARKVPYI